MCYGSKLTHSLEKQLLVMTFRLACDQVVHIETEAILCARQHNANDVFVVCSVCF